jgi:protease-4
LLRIPVLLLLTLLTSPLRILVTCLFRLKRRRRSVVTWTVGGERRPMEPQAFEKTLETLLIISEDSRIAGLHIEIRAMHLGWSQLYQLRDAIAAVAHSGTHVHAYLSSGGGRELLIASVAHRVSMPPPAELYLTGVATSVRFFGDALTKLGVEADLESAGAYKSFGEAYTRSHPTSENREAMEHLLGDLHRTWMRELCEGRKMDLQDLDTALASSPIAASDAVERGLIDAATYPDEDWTVWEELLGGEARKISLKSYARLSGWIRKMPRLKRKRSLVAVVHLDGPVVERREQMARGGRVIASDDVVPVLEELAENDHVKAVVLAVNSPGGSALASDLIARSVTSLAAKKPVVASMGNVAASGGYYISAKAHEIWAHRATITGSIGVVGGKVVFGNALAKLGVHSTWMGPAPDPGLLTPHARFDTDQRRRFRDSLRRVYGRFIDIVAQGRGKTTEQVEAVAQGRVWTGTQAIENGLVDQLGVVDDAVRAAAARADLSPERIKIVPVRFDPPKFGAVSQLMRGSLMTPETLVRQLLDSDSIALQMLYSCPGEPLALESWVLDDAAWSGWVSP